MSLTFGRPPVLASQHGFQVMCKAIVDFVLCGWVYGELLLMASVEDQEKM